MKKKIIAFALAAMCIAGACFGATGCGSSDATVDEGTTIRVGYWGGTCEMALFTAMTQGYLEDQGFTVEPVQIGYSDVVELMSTGDLDVYLCTPTDIMSMKEGLPVYFIDSMHTGCFEGCASADSGIQTVADLKGKKIAVDMIGSVAYVQICSEMVRLGYSDDPQNDVNWVVYDTSTMMDALEKGEIDGFCTSDQLVDTAVANLGAVEFFSDTNDEYFQNTLCCFAGMRTELVDNDPEIAKAFCAALKKSCEFIDENPEEAVDAAIEAGYLATDNPEMCYELVKGYQWLAGDEDMYMSSFKEHLYENWRAGLLDDAPEYAADGSNDEAFEDYCTTFIEEHGRYSGAE